ncbi:MAG TPA: DUF2089 family protein [Epsilonproteobacteria bacterium]|nr:DUF2089 family protein [Campylobacterota bacterium]
MTKCLICSHELTIERLSCEACQTHFEGKFHFPRLARLSTAEQQLTESLIVHGGNLKEMAESLDVSYPTLKKRLLELSNALHKHKKEDKQSIENILQSMETGELTAQEGIKLIREINGEL